MGFHQNQTATWENILGTFSRHQIKQANPSSRIEGANPIRSFLRTCLRSQGIVIFFLLDFLLFHACRIHNPNLKILSISTTWLYIKLSHIYIYIYPKKTSHFVMFAICVPRFSCFPLVKFVIHPIQPTGCHAWKSSVWDLERNGVTCYSKHLFSILGVYKAMAEKISGGDLEAVSGVIFWPKGVRK